MHRRRVVRRNLRAQSNLDAASIKALGTQRVAEVLTNRNVRSRKKKRGAGGDSTQGGNGSHPRAYTYKEFRDYKTTPFLRNEGVVGLTHLIEKMESVFEIRFYVESCKVKFVVCTFKDTSLSWWNSHVKTMEISIANSFS